MTTFHNKTVTTKICIKYVTALVCIYLGLNVIYNSLCFLSAFLLLSEVQVCVWVCISLNCFRISGHTDGQQCDTLCISQQKSQRLGLSTVCVLTLTWQRQQRQARRGNISVYFTSTLQSQHIFDRMIPLPLPACCCICNNNILWIKCRK